MDDARRLALHLTDQDALLLEIDRSLYGFSVVKHGEDGRWHRVDPATVSPAEAAEADQPAPGR